MTVRLALLVITAQLADLALMGLALGHGTEVGPLAPLLASGGYGAVALVKVAGMAAMLAILALYQRRTGHGRRLALLAGWAGVVGAASGLAAIA